MAQGTHHLFVSLRSGILLILNLYFIQSQVRLRLSSARYCTLVKVQALQGAAVVICEDQSYIACVENHDLILKPLSDQVTNLIPIGNYYLSTTQTTISLAHLSGPAFEAQLK